MITPTQAQERSLRKLFGGNHLDREQVISLHTPAKQEEIRGLMKTVGNTDKLLAIMFSDLKRASDEMKAHPDDQFWRRMTIRTVAATVEGIIFCLKQTALTTGPMNRTKFSEEERSFLMEKALEGTPHKKFRLLSFRDNLKETFKLFSKTYNVPCPTSFDQERFAALCETFALRNRLVHPKSFMTFCVNDDERKRAGDAIQWLNSEITKLFDHSSKSLENAGSKTVKSPGTTAVNS